MGFRRGEPAHSRRPRVLVVSHEATATGAPRVALELLTSFEHQGWEGVGLLRWGGPLQAEFEEESDRFLAEPGRRIRAVLLRSGWTKRHVVPWLERFAARMVIGRVRPDLVWCNTVISAPYAVAAAAAGVPSVVHSHEQEGIVRRVVERSRLRLAVSGRGGRPPVPVACATEAAEVFARALGVEPAAVRVVHSPVDVEAIRETSGTQRREPGERRVVLACGTADARKGVDIFIEASRLATGNGAEWWWVGAQGETTVESPVRFLGERADATSLIAQADVFVLPSRADAFPLVVLEAMALGRPVVATDLPGPREQLGDAGVMVPVEQPDELAAEVETLLRDPARARALGSAAALRCERLWGIDEFRHKVAGIAQEAMRDPEPRLMAAHLLWRLTEGAGLQIVVRRLAAGVDPEHVTLTIVSARDTVDRDVGDDLPVESVSLGVGSRRGPGWRLRLMARAAVEVARLRPDVVQLHSGTAWMGVLARLRCADTPFLLEVHAAPGSDHHGAWTDRLEGWMVRHLGVVALCHSSSVREQVEQRWRPPRDSIEQFPLAVDTSRFDPGTRVATARGFRESLGIGDDTFLVLAVGRLAASKRFEHAIELLAKLRAAAFDAELLVVGRGPEGDRLRAVAADRGVSEFVHLPGKVVGEGLLDAYAASDVLLSPSDYEGFGLTIVEGMAAGLPVVATAVGGVTDIVVDGNTGFLVQPGDVDALTDRVRALLISPDLRHEFGANGRRRAVEVFDVAQMCRAFTSLYQKMSQRSGRG